MSVPLKSPSWEKDEASRNHEFPVCKERIFLAHAAVTALPRRVAEAMSDYSMQSAAMPQEFAGVLRDFRRTRELAATLIGARWQEIALLGPTSLGLSLFANGIDWNPGDEVVCYADDYPANVYPWLELERKGVVVRRLHVPEPGAVTPEALERVLSPRTRLVALASCHFFSGYRLDVEAIGRMLHARGILFALDAIQTLGVFPLDVCKAHVDMLSADAHKWMLGPMAMGIVYVAERHFETVRPTLLGAWNVNSPRFLTQEKIEFVPTAQRYEPGVLNAAGVYGMKAALELLLAEGVQSITARVTALRSFLYSLLLPLQFKAVGPLDGPRLSGILTVWHPVEAASKLFALLESEGIVASLRFDREGREYLRFSPHFYNTESELIRVAEVLAAAVGRA